eukprot:653142_1
MSNEDEKLVEDDEPIHLWCVRHGERLEDSNIVSEWKVKPKYIYVSPMLRMLQTAFEICKILKLNMIIVPSLCLGAHIVHQNGIKYMDSNHHCLALKQSYIDNVRSVFMSKQEIMRRFQCKCFEIHFLDIIHSSFNECIQDLIQTQSIKHSECNTILCVSHREKYMDFNIDFGRFKFLKPNIFGIVNLKRKKHNPNHC